LRFKSEPQPHKNQENYSKDEFEISLKFSKVIVKEFEEFVKGIVLFGSAAKTVGTSDKSDIDILIIVDDVTIIMNDHLVEAYRIIVEKAVNDVSRKIHVTTLKLTSFWEYVRSGDPIALNILRDGVPILDAGFFNPLQALLAKGRIRPTPEATWAYFVKAPATMHNSKWHILQATLDLYWAVIDAAHAALMKYHQVPPSPEHVADLLEEKLVKAGRLDKKYAHTMRVFYKLSKQIIHREIREMPGASYDKYYKMAFSFVNEMKRLIESKK
jgi:predicted nucleotidyltransferase